MILGALTNAVVVAVPTMGLSVLLPEISKTLNLNLVQAGLVWGIGSLPMLFAGLLAGTLNDRYGPKRILTVSCLLIGLTGALRSISPNFTVLMVTVFLCGCFGPLVNLSNFKNAVIWFPASELGFANGLATLGMALGFFVGSMISASYLSPALDGWRNVFIFYGAIAMLFAIPWSLTHQAPQKLQSTSTESSQVSFRRSMTHLVKIRELWFLGLAVMGVSGGVQGVLGYLPLYLQSLGWTVSSIGGVLASFHVSSMIFVLPLTLLSDRLGSRSKILIGAALLTAIGIGLLSFVEGMIIWVTVIMIGSVRDGFMAIFFTSVNETRGVDSVYSGLAIGFAMFFMGVGNLIAPPLGNSLASQTNPGIPLIFWAALVIFGALCIFLASGRKLAMVNHKSEGIEEL